MIKDSLEITLLYYSNEGREVSFNDLVENREVMDEKHYDPSEFWSMLGGFDVTLNGHLTIFHSCSFYCLVKATSFLIHSLYWIKGKQSEWFDTEDNFPEGILVNPTPTTSISLQRISNGDILFSHLPPDQNQVQKRGERYFRDIKINADDWFNESDLALNEYFKILRLILNKSDKSGRLVATMTEYLKVWQDISNSRTS